MIRLLKEGKIIFNYIPEAHNIINNKINLLKNKVSMKLKIKNFAKK